MRPLTSPPRSPTYYKVVILESRLTPASLMHIIQAHFRNLPRRRPVSARSDYAAPALWIPLDSSGPQVLWIPSDSWISVCSYGFLSGFIWAIPLDSYGFLFPIGSWSVLIDSYRLPMGCYDLDSYGFLRIPIEFLWIPVFLWISVNSY